MKQGIVRLYERCFQSENADTAGTEMLLSLHEATGNYFAGNRWPCLLVHMPFLINILYDFYRVKE